MLTLCLALHGAVWSQASTRHLRDFTEVLEVILADYQELEDREQRRSYVRRRRECAFCTDRSKVIDYKDTELLQRYVTDHARMRPRRTTGTCAKHQRALAKAIKRARHLALLPYSTRHVQFQRG